MSDDPRKALNRIWKWIDPIMPGAEIDYATLRAALDELDMVKAEVLKIAEVAARGYRDRAATAEAEADELRKAIAACQEPMAILAQHVSHPGLRQEVKRIADTFRSVLAKKAVSDIHKTT